LERYGNGYALILPDDGFISLREGWRRSPLDWDIFFQITQQLADILHYLHRQQIVHKDIKPANILIHPTTHQLKLIDFSIASLLDSSGHLRHIGLYFP
jgi:serine/threonine protein kinase